MLALWFAKDNQGVGLFFFPSAGGVGIPGVDLGAAFPLPRCGPSEEPAGERAQNSLPSSSFFFVLGSVGE